MDLRSRLADIDARISDAARSAGRDPSAITRIVVTKFHPVDLVHDLAGLGVTDVGENRQQELTAKREAYEGDPVRWHFIGQAQTNKARAVRRDADAVHSLDRARLADALHAARPEDDDADILDVLIQVNLTDDPGRGGVDPEGVAGLAEHVAATCPSLRLRGVMAVAPLGEEPAPAFERLLSYAQSVRAIVPDADWISAGMTGDFAEAIAAGATHLRIGSAITGPRPVHG
ncbi:YggS family pyridoxal phosphate-dependent enzyme [Microbacterium sp. NPDC091382]|uniref:YggS family pyridoxal phosphate-dependent enzyme n=1 Tax=Microbacterium sp. NPDC091382 TaxID=3364210 RepID=UPI0038227F6C